MRLVSNEEFEIAWKFKLNRFILKKYGPEEEQEQMIVLWLALSRFDSTKGASFTTYLSKMGRWRRLTISRVKGRKNFIPLDEISYEKKDSIFGSLQELLTENEYNLIKARFIEGKTLSEIAFSLKQSISNVHKCLNKIYEKIRLLSPLI